MAQCQVFVAQTALVHHLLFESRISYLYTWYMTTTRRESKPIPLNVLSSNETKHRETCTFVHVRLKPPVYVIEMPDTNLFLPRISVAAARSDRKRQNKVRATTSPAFRPRHSRHVNHDLQKRRGRCSKSTSCGR